MSHIALLLPELEAGGAQRVMLMLARGFKEHGHKVDIVLMRATGALLAEIPGAECLVDLGAKSHGFGQLGFSISSAWRLSRWVKRERPDVMLSTITGANLVAVLARNLAGVSLRLVIREAVTLKNVDSVLRLRAMRWLYPQADAVIALSQYMREELVSKVGISLDRINCIANPVDVTFIRKQALVPVNHPWLKNGRHKVVISVGRLIPQKDYGTLLRAFAMLPEGVSARLIIVGEGPERSMLEKLMGDLGIEDRVQLIGFDDNPWRWVARADLFALSSQWEGHPNSLLEALVLGKPVVVTSYDTSVYEVFDMVPGSPHAVVGVGDASALVEAVSKLIGEQGDCSNKAMDGALLESVAAYEEVILR